MSKSDAVMCYSASVRTLESKHIAMGEIDLDGTGKIILSNTFDLRYLY